MDSEKSASCCSRICGARDDGANMPGRKKKKEEKRAKNGEKRLKTAKNGKKNVGNGSREGEKEASDNIIERQ